MYIYRVYLHTRLATWHALVVCSDAISYPIAESNFRHAPLI